MENENMKNGKKENENMKNENTKKMMPVVMLSIGIIIGIFANRYLNILSKIESKEDVIAKESANDSESESDSDNQSATDNRKKNTSTQTSDVKEKIAANDSDNKDSNSAVRDSSDDINSQYVSSETVSMSTVPEQIPITGKLAFNAEYQHLVSTRVPGRLDKILVFEGAKVQQGQALAEIYSPDFVSAENEYLLARSTLRTFQEAGNTELINDAKATEQSAVNKLQVLGASDEDIENLSQTGATSNHLLIRAPMSGLVIKRNMDPGAFLNVGDNFMTIVDTEKLWFYGNIYEQDYSKIKLNQKIQLSASALPGKQFVGYVCFISPNIDPVTHTLSIRCDVPNPDGDLRPELFCMANLSLSKKKAVIVPKTALIQIKDANFVIVEEDNGSYRRIPVTIMNLQDDRIAVFSGLNGNERVVTKGAILINNKIDS